MMPALTFSTPGQPPSIETTSTLPSSLPAAFSASQAPAAAGAWEALKAAGKDDGSVTVVSIDGGCPGVENVKAGIIGATSQQYPLKMASMALEAIAAFAKDGTKPTVDPALGFLDTGATLITDKPAEGVESITSEEGLKLCWG